MQLTNLRELRRRKALTQQELADLAGIHRVTVARIESGADQPEAATIRKLAQALSVDPADLFSGAIPTHDLNRTGSGPILEAIELRAAESSDVTRLLAEDERLTPLVLAACDRAKQYFGSTHCRLRHYVDPEYGDERLLLEIVTSLDVPNTIAALHRFISGWWGRAGRDVATKLCIGPVWS